MCVVCITIAASVSIHAPARGATHVRSLHNYCSISFNPRSRAGSDLSPISVPYTARCFNPRSRAGSDRGRGPVYGAGKGFNPRLRAGGDRAQVRF